MFNQVWLAVALIGTFLTIFLIGVVVDMVLSSRRRYVSVLRTQVGETADSIASLREQQLKSSVLERLVFPFAGKVVGSVARLTPLDLYARTNRLIVLAGNPPALTAERIVAFKIVFGIAGLVLGFMAAPLLPFHGMIITVGAAVLFMLMGYTAPSASLAARASKRQKEIRKAMSDTMDLLTISVEAGLGFDAALAQVVKNVPGPLSEEIARMLQEMQIGVTRAEALHHLNDRTEVPELDGFVLSMIQADKYGVGVAKVLRAQSTELRQKRRQRAEEVAQKVPLKLLFPTIFMILPALFIVILGPGAIKVVDLFFK
ncbi:MAG TPA: type II secretion system F family protein [Actinomycetota bacterium]|jgi:tight adherence protein C|nr:type II secretion system F family protein [Actinomycetota bacterium]